MRRLCLAAAGLLLVACAAGCADESAPLPGPVGVYVLDKADYARALLAARPIAGREGDASEAARKARAEAVARARKEAARIDIHLVLEPDGRFVVRYRFDEERGRYGGTWEQDADRLTLVTTHAPSGPLGSARTTLARYGPAGLRFEAGEVPRPFLLRRTR